jgi:hypothetical protein
MIGRRSCGEIERRRFRGLIIPTPFLLLHYVSLWIYFGAPLAAKSTRYIRVSAKMNNVPGGPKTRFPHPGSPNAILPINRPDGFQT